MKLRFSDGVPLLQDVTAFWLLWQWDWRREAFRPELHGL